MTDLGYGKYKIVSDVTIKGITNEVNFTANVSESEATADIAIDRSKFDVKYGSGSFFGNLGDRALNDEFNLAIKLTID